MKLEDFHGGALAAGWEDFKFGVRPYRDVRRLAVVGDRRWERVMTGMFKPFILGEARYFAQSELGDAHAWIAEGVPTTHS